MIANETQLWKTDGIWFHFTYEIADVIQILYNFCS